MSESETVAVEIAGRTYRLRSGEGGADLESVAALVNERIGAILAAMPELSRERAAILAALNMGDELLRQQAAAEAEAGAVEAAVEAVRGKLRDLAARLAASGASAGPSPD